MSITAEEAYIDTLSDEEAIELALQFNLLKTKFTLSDLYVKTKPPHSKLVPLIPNETQVLYLDDIQRACPTFDWRNDKYDLTNLKADVLKYRQWGCSTITLGLYMLDCVNNPHVETRVLAHTPDSTLHLLGIARTMYENLDEHRRPTLVYDNRGELGFSNGSRIKILLVGSKGAGRANTVKNLLMSERAWWPSNGNDVEFGLIQAVPPNCNIVRETTANGLDDFYQQYQSAKRGEADVTPLFYGWAPHKEYSQKPPPNFNKTDKEVALQTQYDLTDGQLAWRRSKIKESQRLGKVFEQEYPLNDIECFVGSGNNYYNNKYLLELATRMKSPEEDENHEPILKMEVGENGFHAQFRIWKMPEPGSYYVVGADPAGGLSRTGKSDFSSMHILELETWEEVLHYHGTPDPWDFGRDMAALATWYNDANVAVLRINHGHEVIRALKETGCMGIVTDDDDQFGIIENLKTKPQLDDALGTCINDMVNGEPGIIFHSVETVEELITYSKLPGGRAGASGTAHDDRQCSLKVAIWQLIRDDRRYRIPAKEPPTPEPAYGNHYRRSK